MTYVSRPRFGKIINPHHVDWAVVFGPNVKWVEDDTYDLLSQRPEVLLGYRVMMATPDTVQRGALNGISINKIVFLDAPDYVWPGWFRAHGQPPHLPWAMPRLMTTDFSKAQWWHVHRVTGIYQIGETKYIGRRY